MRLPAPCSLCLVMFIALVCACGSSGGSSITCGAANAPACAGEGGVPQCPSSCPKGSVVVQWANGGSSGCDCEADACDAGTLMCADSLCHPHGTGCNTFLDGRVMCN